MRRSELSTPARTARSAWRPIAVALGAVLAGLEPGSAGALDGDTQSNGVECIPAGRAPAQLCVGRCQPFSPIVQRGAHGIRNKHADTDIYVLCPVTPPSHESYEMSLRVRSGTLYYLGVAAPTCQLHAVTRAGGTFWSEYFIDDPNSSGLEIPEFEPQNAIAMNVRCRLAPEGGVRGSILRMPIPWSTQGI